MQNAEGTEALCEFPCQTHKQTVIIEKNPVWQQRDMGTEEFSFEKERRKDQCDESPGSEEDPV